MSTRCARAVVFSLIALAAACAPSLPAAYVQNSEAARDAYSQGQYRKAAAHWQTARRYAPNQRYRDEAAYRQAMSLERAGEPARAQALLDELARGEAGARRARARFDAAYLSIENGDSEEGFRRLEAALLAHPNSGPALRALKTLLDHARETGGDAAEQRLLTELSPKLQSTEVHQLLLYSRAKLVQRTQPADAAISAYSTVIDSYPYPHGLYWDDAILIRAQLLVERGRAKEAVASLREMLGHREASDFLGSYERHYGQAHYLLARITHEQLHDPASARNEFRRVARNYQTSLVRDDALWQAMLCSKQLGEPTEVCNDARRLVHEFPESRFSGCAHRVCAEVAASGECRDYVMQSWLDTDDATPPR